MTAEPSNKNLSNYSGPWEPEDLNSPPRLRRGGRDEVEDGVVEKNCRLVAPRGFQPPLPGSGIGPRHPLLVQGGEPSAHDCQ